MRHAISTRRWLVLGGLWLLTGCSLTSENVEPALPSGRVNESSTLVYRADGKPVVSNNSTDIITIIVAAFGDSRAVVAKLLANNTLAIRTTNTPPSGVGSTTSRRLELNLQNFTGPGVYPLLGPAAAGYSTFASYQEYYPSGNGTGYTFGPAYGVLPGASAQVTVTSWNSATRQLQGTFELTVAARPAGTPRFVLTEGKFDLTVDQ